MKRVILAITYKGIAAATRRLVRQSRGSGVADVSSQTTTATVGLRPNGSGWVQVTRGGYRIHLFEFDAEQKEEAS